MGKPYCIGLDFGTTMSGISVGREEDSALPVCIEFNNHRRIDTVLRLTPDGSSVEEIGQNAWEEFAHHPERTFFEFKPDLGQGKHYLRERFETTPEALTRMFLERLRGHLENYLNEELVNLPVGSVTVVGHPAGWDAARVELLRKIAGEAGFPAVQACPEPVAAVYRHLDEIGDTGDCTLFVYDFGGGTTDVAVCRVMNGRPTIVYADGGDNLGGKHYDERLATMFKERPGLKTLSPGDEAEIRRQARKAKEKLSDKIKEPASVNTINIRCAFQTHSEDIPVTREEFERLCGALIRRFDEPIRSYLTHPSAAQYKPDVVVATGGSSQLYFVRERLKGLEGKLRCAKIPQESIAVGLGLARRYQNSETAQSRPNVDNRQIRSNLRKELSQYIKDFTLPEKTFFQQPSAKRVPWANEQIKAFHVVLLKWAQASGLIPADEYAGEVKEGSRLGQYMLGAGLMTAGGGGAAAALMAGLATVTTTVAAPGAVGTIVAWLGLTGSLGTIGTATVATATWPLWVTVGVAAAPLAVVAGLLWWLRSWFRGKEYAKVKEAVEKAKEIARTFYEEQIDNAEMNSLLYAERITGKK